jgi:hypothetical protein
MLNTPPAIVSGNFNFFWPLLSAAAAFVGALAYRYLKARGVIQGSDGREDLAHYVAENRISAEESARILAAAKATDVSEVAYYVAEKKISVDDAVTIMEAAGGHTLDEILHHVSKRKLSVADAVTILQSPDGLDIDEVAHAVANQGMTVEEAVRAVREAAGRAGP